MLGTIVLASDRGFRFAEADSTHQSIFIHQLNVNRRRFLHVNERIKFDLARSIIKPGEVEAINVEWIGTVVAHQISGTAVQS